MNVLETIGDKKVFIETNVVGCDPFLLSKEAMKKASMQIDFTSDVVTIFGKPRTILFTSIGHYCIPLENTMENLLLEIIMSPSVLSKMLVQKKKLQHFSHPTDAYPQVCS